MSIKLAPLPSRKQVAWLNEPVPADGKRAFEDREYAVTSCTDEELETPEYLSGLSAVVFTQSEKKPLQITKDLERHGRRLLDYDCLIILRPTASRVHILINKIDDLRLPVGGLPVQMAEKLRGWHNPDDGDPPLPCAQYFHTSVPWQNVANFISESKPGPAPNRALKIAVDNLVDDNGMRVKVTLSEQAKLLLQRAFYDCNDLHLTPQDGGRSGVSVYRACAELTGGLFGQWPQPHFVKIGHRKKIFAEYKVYEENVVPYIPFHLGPHLLRDRCCLGATEGVIVGDYVEESESLGYCAYDGRSSSAIACLFDRTLLGWHRRASEVKVSLSAGLLRCFPRKIDTTRMERARKLGATRELVELRELFKLCTSIPVLAGPIHGDLHAANVRVRATDAIVIDFFAHRKDLPLLLDAATLEASLLVQGFPGGERNAKDWASPEEWLSSVESLYDHAPLDSAVIPANPKSKSFWFHACVLQIRRYARQWECGPHQYAAALALAFLIKATKDSAAREPEASRRAAAYVLAERVLLKTFGAKYAALKAEAATKTLKKPVVVS